MEFITDMHYDRDKQVLAESRFGNRISLDFA